MILLAPRKANASKSLLKPDLLVIGVQRDSDYSVRITPTGSVLVRGTSSVSMRTLDSVSATDIFYKYLPESTRYLDCSRDTDFTPVVSRASQDMEFPAALSLIPLSVHGDMTICTEITLRYQDLCRILPELSGSDAVLVNTAAPSFLPLPSHMEDDIVLNVGLAGSQFLLAPLHVLAPPEDESPWKLALLSPYVSALVETVVEIGNASPSLPTPPPSPPLRATPIVSSSSAATSSPQAAYTPSISLPSLQSVGEFFQENQNPEYAPLTPSSPPATLHEALSVEQPVETKEPENRTSTISRRQPPQGGFFRLLFSWLFRAIFARVCGFIDLGFRWWGFPSMLPHIMLASEGKRNLIQEMRTEEMEKVEEPVNESVEEDIQADVSIQTTTSVSESTLADDSFLSVKEEETNSVHMFEDALSETTIEILKPIADVAPAITELHMPVSKPRFLADVRSNMVSFLVRTPHSRVSPSDLAIAVDGKPVDGTHPGYSCAALSGNIYLLGLHGPADGSKLEITLA
ncbi:hypothetical protein PHLCEN_2v10983 [Hermanssonia centrifuga]|uniref:Uncharacterized protein n=1 Tax=Hermanssonia centrifuga TaxID=98765 RepID=A0A2R6NLI8_9APHY|nr:hypothetical protein PHLCEN_2v10983 [Hermanssonia centrifuga]